MLSRLSQSIAVGRFQLEPVDALQLSNDSERLLREGSAALEGVQDDALDQIAQAHLSMLCQRLEHLHQSLFQAHARLYAFDLHVICYHGTWVVANPFLKAHLIAAFFYCE